LVSVNEVGGSPNVVGISPHDFHRSVRTLASNHPRTMTASSTHDTKRGEDTRLRISMISHHLDAWKRAVRGWRSQNKDLRRRVAGSAAPDANDEYLIYQTILGVVGRQGRVDDALRSRLSAYLEKALREAKRHTDWSTPNEAYEAAAADFLSGVLDRLAAAKSEFAVSFREFLETIRPGFEDAVLAQQVVRLVMPGVPDIYRGAEFLDLTLVDPDNRRPVDWDSRQAALERSGAWPKKSLDALPIDERKAAVMQLILRMRRDDPELFVGGEYVPLTVSGAAERLVAFARVRDERVIVAVARIAPGALGEALVQVPYELASGTYTDLVSGTEIATTDALLRLSSCLSSAPVALLVRGRAT
ncbi:MAG: malto-oligosyltrehalose synthase, partial [Spirochaetota bacterium]